MYEFNEDNKYDKLKLLKVLVNSKSVNRFLYTMLAVVLVFLIVLVRILTLVKSGIINNPSVMLLFVSLTLCVIVFNVYMLQLYNKILQIRCRVSIINSVRSAIKGNCSEDDIERLRIYSEVINDDSISADNLESLKLLDAHEIRKLKFSVEAYMDPIEFYILMLKRDVPRVHKNLLIIQLSCIVLNVLVFCVKSYIDSFIVLKSLFIISLMGFLMCLQVENILNILAMGFAKDKK